MLKTYKTLPILISLISLSFCSYGQELEKIEQGHLLRKKYKYNFEQERWDLIQITKYDYASGFPKYDSIFEPQLKQVYTYRNNIAHIGEDSKLISRFIYKKGQKEVFRFEFFGADGKKLYELYDGGNNFRIDAVQPISENKFKQYYFDEYGLVDTSRLTTWENGNIKSLLKNSLGDRGLGPAEIRFDSLGRRTFYYEANWSTTTTYINIGENEVLKVDQSARRGMGSVPADTTSWVADENGNLLRQKDFKSSWQRDFYANGMIRNEQRKTPYSNDTLERYRYEYEGYFYRGKIPYLEFPFGNNLRKLKTDELDIVNGKLTTQYLGYEIFPEHSFIEIRENNDTIWFLTAERAESLDFLVLRKHQVGSLPGMLEFPKKVNMLAVGFKDVNDDNLKDIVILTKTAKEESTHFDAVVYLFETKPGTYIYSTSYTNKLKGVHNFEEVKQKLSE